ncbi:MAG TPA: hypothetical protein VMT91_05880 [Anaerolineales bacterium]|nr:hypothetical protein [Anaerolineales bacterium]
MRIFWRIFAAIVLIVAVLGIGLYAYNVGVAQGLAQKVQVPALSPAQVPYLYNWHPFVGFGFGLLGCLIPLFLLFVAFGCLRMLFWHGPMGWGRMHHRRWDWRDENGKDVPPFFAEWHRRAHAGPEEEKKS